MATAFKLALRNVLAYKRRTLIIGIILAFGAFVLVLGNIVTDTIHTNLRARYVDSFTADVIISADAYPAPSLAPAMPGQRGAGVPEIPDYPAIESFVSSHPAVKSWSPQLQAYVTASVHTAAASGNGGPEDAAASGNDGSEDSPASTGSVTGTAVLMGIDPARYSSTFPSQWEMISGEPPAAGASGLWVTEESMRDLSSETGGASLQPGDKVLLSCLTQTAGIKIREVEIRGVFRYRRPDPQLSRVSYIDALSLQLLLGMNLDPSGDGGAAAGSIVSTDDPEELFGGSLFAEGSSGAQASRGLDPNGLVDFVNSSPSILESVTTVPRFHFLLVRLQERASFSGFTRELGAFAAERGLTLRITDWSAGAGNLGRVIGEVQTVFSFLILAVILVSLFVITNSLVLSVTERIPEIGTLRALGGQRGLIRRIVIVEVLIIGLSFGLAGTALGALLAIAVTAAGVALPGFFLQALLGGETLNLFIGGKSILVSLGVVAATGLAATLYPLGVALKIGPVQAMSWR